MTQSPESLLADHPLLEGLTPSEREALCAVGSFEEVEADHAIMREGDVEDSMVLLLSGRVEITRVGETGQSHHLGEAGPGAALGEVGLLTRHPRSATVVTKAPTSLFRITRQAFQDLLESGRAAAPILLTRVAIALAERSRAVNDRLVELLEKERRPQSHEDFEQLRARLRQALTRHV